MSLYSDLVAQIEIELEYFEDLQNANLQEKITISGIVWRVEHINKQDKVIMCARDDVQEVKSGLQVLHMTFKDYQAIKKYNNKRLKLVGNVAGLAA